MRHPDIGEVRRALFTSRPSRWNAFVRDFTARIEGSVLAALAIAVMVATSTGMARAQATPDVWIIQGTITVPGESTPRTTRYYVPDEDHGGAPALLAFRTKEVCEDARGNDPTITGPLEVFKHVVESRGASVEIACVRFEHPKPGQEI